MKKILSLFVLGAFVTFTQAQAQPSAKAPAKTANSTKTVSKPVCNEKINIFHGTI